MNKYNSFTALIQNEPPDSFEIEYRVRSEICIVIAPHGGDIEPGTSEIADFIAGDNFSFYSFNGCKTNGNWDLHMASEKYDEKKALELVAASETAISIHGARKDEPKIYIGGLNTQLMSAISIALHRAGFPVGQVVPTKFGGVHPDNICNKCKTEQGVQIELTHGLRQKMFKSLSQTGRKRKTDLFHLFVKTVRNVLNTV